jgi:hypothetical protein
MPKPLPQLAAADVVVAGAVLAGAATPEFLTSLLRELS